MLRRLVEYGHGFHPLGRPTPEDFQQLKEAMSAAGRDIAHLEMIGGTQAVFPDDRSPADLGAALSLGVRFLGGPQKGLTLLTVPTFWQQMAQGTALVAGAALACFAPRTGR